MFASAVLCKISKENMSKKLKEIPIFKSEDEECKFWAKEDSTNFIDWEQGKASVLPNLRSTTKTISLQKSKLEMNLKIKR